MAPQAGLTASAPAAIEFVNGTAWVEFEACTKAPSKAAERPCTCSSRNGFLFCGIAELDPTNSSGRCRKSNSAVVHCNRSVASLLKVTAQIDAAASTLNSKSREATASIEFNGPQSKPSSSAVRAVEIGNDVPATAPAPRGQERMSAEAKSSPSKSLSEAAAMPAR